MDLEAQASAETSLQSEVVGKIFKGLEDLPKPTSKAPVSPQTPRDDSPAEMRQTFSSSRRYLDDSPDQERDRRTKLAEEANVSTAATQSLEGEMLGDDGRENRGGETQGSTTRGGGQVEELLRQILAKQSQAETERLKDRREFSLWRHEQVHPMPILSENLRRGGRLVDHTFSAKIPHGHTNVMVEQRR